MADRAVADTGPLVAVVRTHEKGHNRCVATLKTLRAPLLTCWPVLTEAAWLLRDEPSGLRAIGRLIGSGRVELVELDAPALMERYASAEARMADAAFGAQRLRGLRLSEIEAVGSQRYQGEHYFILIQLIY